MGYSCANTRIATSSEGSHCHELSVIARAGERRPRKGKGGRPRKLTREDVLGIEKESLKGQFVNRIKDWVQ